jgi:hypothetical protein
MLSLSTVLGGYFFFTHKNEVQEAMDAGDKESMAPPSAVG